jgi:hypothetical protein
MKRDVDVSNVDFERPPFLDPERMDKAIYIQPTPAFGGLSAGLFQNAARPIDISDENSTAPVYQIPVLFRSTPSHGTWRVCRKNPHLAASSPPFERIALLALS